MSTATKQATAAQANLLRTIARLNDAAGGTAAPVSGRYARSAKVLLANGWVTRKAANLYVVTAAGRAAAGVEAPTRSVRTWDATASQTHTCAGACGETKPASAFPTTHKAGHRGVECRSCRDARRSAA